jgi:hypothetical protein
MRFILVLLFFTTACSRHFVVPSHLNLSEIEYSLATLAMQYDITEVKAKVIYSKNTKPTEAVVFANSLNVTSKPTADTILQIDFFLKDSDSKIVAILPIPANVSQVDAVNLVFDGTMVDSFITKVTAVKRGKGSVRFSSASLVPQIAEISLFLEDRSGIPHKGGIALRKNYTMSDNKKYANVMPIANVLAKHFFPNHTKITTQGMSFGFVKASLALSHSTLHYDITDFLIKQLFIVSWNGLIAPNKTFLSGLGRFNYAIFGGIYTKASADVALQDFIANINAKYIENSNTSEIIAIAGKILGMDKISELKTIIKQIVPLNKQDECLARILLLPPIVVQYGEKDVLIDGKESMAFFNKFYSILYASLPKKIANGYAKFNAKYSNLTSKPLYFKQNYGIVDLLKHNPDIAQMQAVVELEISHSKYDVIKEILLLSGD